MQSGQLKGKFRLNCGGCYSLPLVSVQCPRGGGGVGCGEGAGAGGGRNVMQQLFALAKAWMG